jgi:hypothetical protein
MPAHGRNETAPDDIVGRKTRPQGGGRCSRVARSARHCGARARDACTGIANQRNGSTRSQSRLSRVIGIGCCRVARHQSRRDQRRDSAPGGRWNQMTTECGAGATPVPPVRIASGPRDERNDVVRTRRRQRFGGWRACDKVDAQQNRYRRARANGERAVMPIRVGCRRYRSSSRACVRRRRPRVEITSPDRGGSANRELGTREGWTSGREGSPVRLDSGRTAGFSPRGALHLDYGYAVTSHSSQGQTADRVCERRH